MEILVTLFETSTSESHFLALHAMELGFVAALAPAASLSPKVIPKALSNLDSVFIHLNIGRREAI